MNPLKSCTHSASFSQVGNEISRVTSDMRVIADGLGSGVSPEQLEQSVRLGNQWLDEIKSRDFSPERQRSFEKKNAASDMVNSVEAFTKPVEEFNNNVTGVQGTIIDLRDKMEDLRNNSMAAQDQVKLKPVSFQIAPHIFPQPVCISFRRFVRLRE